MKSIGLPISHKENENRRALLPCDCVRLERPEKVYVERGYGIVLGYEDADYLRCGVQVCDRDTVLRQDVICDPKIGDADYLERLFGQTVFGWVHAVQNREITDKLLKGRLTAYAWEDMFEDGRHVFWRNNEIAGEAAIMHAFQCYGEMPYNTKAAILGRGNTAHGALKILTLLGADVRIYDRKTEKLFQQELATYDVIVNAVLWDTSRRDHIVYREDLKRMRPGALIIDISCDRNGGIETSVPTTIEEPTYVVDAVWHYVVDHTPSLFYKAVSKELSTLLPDYLNALSNGVPTDCLLRARAVFDGVIEDTRISAFQGR